MLKISSLIIFFVFLAFDAFASDYSSWQEFLNLYVKGGQVNYSAVKNDPDLLKDVISQFENLKKEEYDKWSQDEKKAFWINAYNIAAIKVVIDHYPLNRSLSLKALRYPSNSIQQISDVWNKPILKLLGNEVSLNYIENEVLRKEFQDPRIHFAIVCAALGCPALRGEAYVPERLNAQLDDQGLQLVHDSTKFRYDSSQDVLFLSPIFKWFNEDFAKEGGVIVFLKKYTRKSAAKLSDKTRVKWLDYDWSLNEQQLK